jgi:hypothetical protein
MTEARSSTVHGFFGFRALLIEPIKTSTESDVLAARFKTPA